VDPIGISGILLGTLGSVLGATALVLTLRGTPRRLLEQQEELFGAVAKSRRELSDLATECGALETSVERKLEEMEGLHASIETKRRRTRASQQQIEQHEQNGEAHGDDYDRAVHQARAMGMKV